MMRKLLKGILLELEGERSVVLCSIVASSGSTPRGAGAKMAVFADGSTVGTIGGGAVEYHATQVALEVHQSGASHTQGFVLKRNEVADIGMICGGDVTVYFQFLDGKNPDNKVFIGDILGLFDEKVNSWLVTSIGDGTLWDMGVYVERRGFVGGKTLEIDQVALHCLGSAVLTDHLYVEPLTTGATVYVFGGGHVSQALVPVISNVNFRTVVYENRQAFAEKSLFPGASQVILGNFTDIVQNCNITAQDYIIIMTRGHNDDYDVLVQALRTPASYVGVIGSRKKVKTTFARLYEDGFTTLDTDRIFTPIGLEIGAETPGEIAISIAGQLIAHRAGLL